MGAITLFVNTIFTLKLSQFSLHHEALRHCRNGRSLVLLL